MVISLPVNVLLQLPGFSPSGGKNSPEHYKFQYTARFKHTEVDSILGFAGEGEKKKIQLYTSHLRKA